MPRKQKVWLAIGYVRDTKTIMKEKMVGSHPTAITMATNWAEENDLVLFGIIEIVDHRMEDLMDICIRFFNNKNRVPTPYSDSRRKSSKK